MYLPSHNATIYFEKMLLKQLMVDDVTIVRLYISIKIILRSKIDLKIKKPFIKRVQFIDFFYVD